MTVARSSLRGSLAGLVMLLAIMAGCGSSSDRGDGGDDADAGMMGRSDAGLDGVGGRTVDAGSGGGTVIAGSGGGTVDAGAGGATVDVDAAGTGTDAGPVPTPTTAIDLCRVFCQRVTMCDTTRDRQTCVNACSNSNSALFPKLRPEVIASIATCITRKDCAMISQDTSLRTCAGEAAAVIGPSAVATALCTAADAAQTQCGVTIDRADCLTSVKIYSDATLTEAMSCTTKSCSLIFPCTSATLNGATGAWSLGGGVRPGKKCGGSASPCSFFGGSSMVQCQAAGCTHASTCSGTVSCSSAFSITSCQALTGCTWSGTACSGATTVLCSAQTTSATCNQFFSCFFSGTCTGTVPLCTTLGVAKCSTQPGCIVQDAI